MAQPRFQMVLLSRRSTSERRLVWRLLGANNRELGRSGEVFDHVAECEGAIRLLKRSSPNDLDARISFDAGTRGWRWRLTLEARVVAESSRTFSRQRECKYSLEQFMSKLTGAVVTALRDHPLVDSASHCRADAADRTSSTTSPTRTIGRGDALVATTNPKLSCRVTALKKGYANGVKKSASVTATN